MSDNQNISTQCEYFFFFLLNTQISTADGTSLEEPESLKFGKQVVTQNGLHFEKDKRLFLRGESGGKTLDNWNVHLQQGWDNICQLYAEHFDNQEVAKNYCYQALFGVALVILDDGESVAHHSVHVRSQDKEYPLLRFVKPQSAEFLFSIGKAGDDKKAYFHQFVPITSNGKVSRKNLQLCLSNANTPQLTPFELGELQPNPVFLVCALSYGGGGQWKSDVWTLLSQKSAGNKPPFLVTVFARLIMGQWQFRRMDEEARELRNAIQCINNDYRVYAMQDGGIRPQCTRSRTLATQLQEMQSQKSEARLMMSRLGGALQTLDINGDNLANRLEQIRQAASQQNWQIHFHKIDEVKKVKWPSEGETPLLDAFANSITKLKDHKAYITQQIEYLESLQEKWQLFLEKKRTLSGEYLNTLVSILILMLATTTGADFTINKGVFGINVENQPLIWSALLIILFIMVIPIIWHFFGWFWVQLRCIFHGIRKWFCRNRFFKKFCSADRNQT
jgi:hypothetical protein